MKILHLSDTHGLHRKLKDLPEADVIVHSGDFTMAGSENEAVDFLKWFCNLSYSHKVFIAGNHDMCLYGATVSGLDDNCQYLCNSGVTIGGVRFYGVPLFMEAAMDGTSDKDYRAIPYDTDVLITHQPPYGILDFDDNYHYGSKTLLQRVEEVKPRLHLFGHKHNSYGSLQLHGTTFSNAALLGEDYGLKKSPALYEI